jgi:hypothetical protein
MAPVGLAMHCCGNPTLIDGLTKPHNPGLEYDIFLRWNQPRLDANEAALAAVGMETQRPVNDWNADAETDPPVGPAYAEGWDDWGPFYTQTYMAFFGVDGSTVEMCNNSTIDPECNGRFGSKRAQYLAFYSSAGFWIANRNPILHDQMEIFRRGVTDTPRVNCCDAPDILSRGFTEDQHNWMVPYPDAFVIPFGGAGQRSDAEANRLADWMLFNGIQVHFLKRAYSWNGQTFPARSYVVFMDQPFRGLALTALDAGQDISDRISQLYAPPGAWSHGELWGADVVEIPADSAFAPSTAPVTKLNTLSGGVARGRADWYSLALGGVSEFRVVLDLLRGGVDGELAEAPFTSATGGPSPAGSLIFDSSAKAALQQAGAAAGVVFEAGRGAKPPTTQIDEAPRVAVLVNSAAPAVNDTLWSLRQIFGSDAQFVSVVLGDGSLQNAVNDPLADFDVIYNAGQTYPSSTNATAQARLQAFFARGGGYIGTRQSNNNFTFLTGAGLVSTLTSISDSAGGGIALWDNVGGTSSPLTGVYPSRDTLYVPSTLYYFSQWDPGVSVDGRYLPDTASMFLAGLWLDRDPLAAGAPVILRGDTTAGSRYLAYGTNPFSRGDAEREWLLMGQAALWSNLTDED